MIEIAKEVGFWVLITIGVIVFVARTTQSLIELLTPDPNILNEPSDDNAKIQKFLTGVEKSCESIFLGLIKSIPHFVVVVSSCVVFWVIYRIAIT